MGVFKYFDPVAAFGIAGARERISWISCFSLVVKFINRTTMPHFLALSKRFLRMTELSTWMVLLECGLVILRENEVPQLLGILV